MSTTHHLIANDEHVQDGIAVGVLHIGIGTVIDQVVVDFGMVKGCRERQRILAIVRMS